MTDRPQRPTVGDMEIAARLTAERPSPPHPFEARLRSELVAATQAHLASVIRARRLVVAYACTGALLLVLAAMSLVGTGPLAS
jgi:hypothetical protein